MTDFLESYSQLITKMGAFPDKLIINKLTMLANDVMNDLVKDVTPRDVANLIQKRILRAEPNCKVPILYLIDSIFHNVNGEYIRLFTGNLTSIFHDTYREVNEKDKIRLVRLLRSWEKRAGKIDQIDPTVLKEIRARLNPDWKAQTSTQEASVPAPSHQTAPLIAPTLMHGSSSSAVVPPGHDINAAATTLNIPPAAPTSDSENVTVLQPPTIGVQGKSLSLGQKASFEQSGAEYAVMLKASACELLGSLQMQIVPAIAQNQKYTLDQVQHERPELYIELIETARNSLASSGIVCWDMKYLTNDAFVTTVIVSLLGLGSANGQVFAAEHNLCFSTEKQRDMYLKKYNEYQAKQEKILQAYSSGTKQPKARNWYLRGKAWLSGATQPAVIDRSFHKTALERSTSEQSIPQELGNMHKVIADDSQKFCPLCGEKFEKVWDDDYGDWVYINAVRPDPNGPIYMEKAFQKHFEDMEGNLSTKRRKLNSES